MQLCLQHDLDLAYIVSLNIDFFVIFCYIGLPK